MNAIRKEETLDNLHSIYVDQWDWEKVIDEKSRTLGFLKSTVRKIVKAIAKTSKAVKLKYPSIDFEAPKDVFFMDSQALEKLYPNMDAKQRETQIAKEHGCVFITQIGYPLKSGLPHDLRAPDYDDWRLNGDLLYFHKTLNIAVEISSM